MCIISCVAHFQPAFCATGEMGLSSLHQPAEMMVHRAASECIYIKIVLRQRLGGGGESSMLAIVHKYLTND